MTNLLKNNPIKPLTVQDWDKAKLYFRANRHADYMEEGISGVPYPFIKIDGVIYAIGINTYLGTGGFGKVRVGEMENGTNVAIKIEPRAQQPSDDLENEILTKAGMFIAMHERTLTTPVSMKMGKSEVLTSNILYRVMELIPGPDLSAVIMANTLTDTQKLIIAIKAVIALKELHTKGILHRDIKGSNMKVVIKDNDISLRILDFGFAYSLQPGEFIKISPCHMGTSGFKAPEIQDESKNAVYSFQSDIYALGILFRNMGISGSVFEPMIVTAPQNRPSYETILTQLIGLLQAAPLDHIALQVITDTASQFGLLVDIPKDSKSEQVMTSPESIIVEPTQHSTIRKVPMPRLQAPSVPRPILPPPPVLTAPITRTPVLEEISINTLNNISALVADDLLEQANQVQVRIAPIRAPGKTSTKPTLKKPSTLPSFAQSEKPAIRPVVKTTVDAPKPPVTPHFLNKTQKKGIPIQEIQEQYVRVMKHAN